MEWTSVGGHTLSCPRRGRPPGHTRLRGQETSPTRWPRSTSSTVGLTVRTVKRLVRVLCTLFKVTPLPPTDTPHVPHAQKNTRSTKNLPRSVLLLPLAPFRWWTYLWCAPRATLIAFVDGNHSLRLAHVVALSPSILPVALAKDECGDWVAALCPYECGCPDNEGDYGIVMPQPLESPASGGTFKVGCLPIIAPVLEIKAAGNI